MLSIINSSNLIGIESFLIKVEVDITNGLPCFNIVGLVGTEIKEARERVLELSKEYKLYRQDYCGCVYSKQEREVIIKL